MGARAGLFLTRDASVCTRCAEAKRSFPHHWHSPSARELCRSMPRRCMPPAGRASSGRGNSVLEGERGVIERRGAPREGSGRALDLPCVRRAPSPHNDACTSTVRRSRMTDVSSGPSGSALCALALGHCLCVPPGGGRPRRRPASENPQVRPQRSNSAPTTPIGPILTRACVPVCVRRCDRARARERATAPTRRPPSPRSP